jgi:hypothetical protein
VAARDPFGLIRQAVWSLLLLGSLASLIVAILNQQPIANAAIDSSACVGFAGALFAEAKIAARGSRVIEEEIANPMLKGPVSEMLNKKDDADP